MSTQQAMSEMDRLIDRLDPESFAKLAEGYLQRRRDELLSCADRDAMVDELAWLQGVDFSVQVHLNQLAAAAYGGRHPKHWLWKSHKRWVLDRVNAGERVLDVGCGCSAYLLWMAQMGCRVVAIDIREEVLAIARAIMSHENLRFQRADIMEGPPASPWDGFDVVVCAHVIEHLDDPVAMLRAMRGVAPRLIVAVPPVDSRWQKVMYRDLGLRWKDDEDHRREYTPELLDEQLREAGWDVREMHAGIDIKALAE
ncbi:MAG: hypothetical protein Tsb0013_17180 [Phycisphaerales bacterium]